LLLLGLRKDSFLFKSDFLQVEYTSWLPCLRSCLRQHTPASCKLHKA